jgi:hypothetical protein
VPREVAAHERRLRPYEVSPSTNGHITGGAKSAQYGSVVAPLFTMVL